MVLTDSKTALTDYFNFKISCSATRFSIIQNLVWYTRTSWGAMLIILSSTFVAQCIFRIKLLLVQTSTESKRPSCLLLHNLRLSTLRLSINPHP